MPKIRGGHKNVKQHALRPVDRLIWILTRSGTIFLVLYFLSSFLVDYHKVEMGAKVRSLNYFKPIAFKSLAQFLKDGRSMDLAKWKEYAFYYEKVVEYIPKTPDAYLLLGFCYYHLGKYDRAIESFQRSIAMSPAVFWPYYNLASIYFQQGRFQDAVEPLKVAVGLNPRDTLAFMDSSRNIYVPILKQYGTDSRELTMRLRKAYRDCYVLLVLSYFHLGDFAQMQQAAQYAVTANVGDSGLFYYYAGLAAYNRENYAQAAEFFKESLKEHFQDLPVKYHLDRSVKASRSKNPAGDSDDKTSGMPGQEAGQSLMDQTIDPKIF